MALVDQPNIISYSSAKLNYQTPMSESIGGPQDGDPDTFAIAQHIMRLASSPWCSPTPESVEMALGIYQAAMKLKSPPVYESNVPSEVKNLQQQLDTISEVIFRANY